MASIARPRITRLVLSYTKHWFIQRVSHDPSILKFSWAWRWRPGLKLMSEDYSSQTTGRGTKR